MSFRAMLRPGQGFQKFRVLRRVGDVTSGGRPFTGSLEPHGEFIAIISEASPTQKEQFKQDGHPITHTVLQRGTKDRATATDVLELDGPNGKTRRFLVQAKPKDPGELGHFLIYHVQEREDLQEKKEISK